MGLEEIGVGLDLTSEGAGAVLSYVWLSEGWLPTLMLGEGLRGMMIDV